MSRWTVLDLNGPWLCLGNDAGVHLHLVVADRGDNAKGLYPTFGGSHERQQPLQPLVFELFMLKLREVGDFSDFSTFVGKIIEFADSPI